MQAFVLGFFGVASLALVGANSGFLQRLPEQALTQDEQGVILAAIEDASGRNHRQAIEVRLAPIVEMLAPTLKSLPKNEQGNFGHATVRYALHRFFVQRHGWFVNGLASSQNGTNAVPTELLQNDVPGLVQSLFESKLGSNGLSEHDLAVMAATLESLAHRESMERLRTAYMLKRISPGANNLTLNGVDELLDLYMALFIVRRLSNPRKIESLLATGDRAEYNAIRSARKFAHKFNETRTFVRRVARETLLGRGHLSSVDVAHVVTRIGDRYGRWQNHECEDIRRTLLSIEDDGTGRVSLAKLYKSYLNDGVRTFEESPEYLRAMGALDEANPSNPRVIVANYVFAPSQCLGGSKYYSLCCLDECEDLMGHIEREIQAPAATATQIADLVAAMPSSIARSNHTISIQLLQRLNDIAAVNRGMVPIHGRIFAQWMHFVYPRECIFPHLSGTTTSLTMLRFEDETGLPGTYDDDDMRQYIENHEDEAEGNYELSWSTEDESYVDHPIRPIGNSARSMLRVTVGFVAMLLGTLAMVRSLLDFGRTAQMQRCEKYV